MFLSIVDIFKIGIGPSSSHTMGPMVAAARFLKELREEVAKTPGHTLLRVRVSLHGSLAFTGRGHATDRAVILGLIGFIPATVDMELAAQKEAALRNEGVIRLDDLPPLDFAPDRDLVFDFGPPLPGHPNGLVIFAEDCNGRELLSRTFYSIGGGFVLSAEELCSERREGGNGPAHSDNSLKIPYPFRTAAEMLGMGTMAGLRIAEMKRANEIAIHGPSLDDEIDKIWGAMDGCIDRGLSQDGVLPGGLSVRRRARAIHQQLLSEKGRNLEQPHVVNDWISLYAMAVNEENAAGGRVVTSPTNGAAGVVPAVVRYYRDHCHGSTLDGIRDFLLVASAVGGIIKHNASISGAEVGLLVSTQN